MDPYLEADWRNVHPRLCIRACEALQPQLQAALIQRTPQLERRPMLQAKIQMRNVIGHDLWREANDAPAGKPLQTSDDGAVAEPLIIPDVFERYIEIIEPENGRRVVTAIEFFTESHKLRGYDQERYLRRRRENLTAGVNLVEIDLLRSGERVLTRYHRIPASYRTTYQVCVRRDYKGQTEVYPVPLQRPLPTIRIPLREGDADAHLDLQSLIGQAFANGSHDSLDYTQPPDPPLDDTDATWAAELLRAPRA
jgi:hypothetical protein